MGLTERGRRDLPVAAAGAVGASVAAGFGLGWFAGVTTFAAAAITAWVMQRRVWWA